MIKNIIEKIVLLLKIFSYLLHIHSYLNFANIAWAIKL